LLRQAIDMKEVAEPYIRRRAMRHLEKGRVVIFGAGTGAHAFGICARARRLAVSLRRHFHQLPLTRPSRPRAHPRATPAGNPFFTTDTGAALRAAEINAQALLKATKVDGVYERDPKRYPDAQLHPHLSYADVITRQELGALDTTAVTLCAENAIPVVVFNLFTPGNIGRAIRGENVGTRVGPAWEPLPGVPPAGGAPAAAAQAQAQAAQGGARLGAGTGGARAR
jgi:uridylate kinase